MSCWAIRIWPLPSRQAIAAEREALLRSANKVYQEALQRDPKNMRGYGGLAEMYTFMGDKDKALETYQRAAKLFPKNSDVYVAMAICCKHFNDSDGAVQFLHQATKLNPDDRRLKINLGFEFAMAKRYKEAYIWLEQYQGAAQAHYSLAQVYERQGDLAQAQNELQLSLQVDPNYRPANDMMAQLADTNQPIGVEGSGGLKTVGYEDLSSIPEYRLAPNARLISQPDPRNQTDKNLPATTPNPLPVTSIQIPEVVPANPSGTLPGMPLGNGWER